MKRQDWAWGFWNYHYRHSMRHLPAYQRKEIYQQFTHTGLRIDGVSDLHQRIIDRVTGDRYDKS